MGGATRSWVGGLFLSTPKMEMSEEKLLSPDWNLQDLNGKEIWLSDTDKPIFINIWATWCGPCKSEMPSINELYNKYKNDIEFIIVSPDESLEILRLFESKTNYQIPFYNAKSFTPSELQTNSYPTTVIIDKEKNISYKLTGAHNWNTEEVHKILDGLINK